MSSEPIVDKQKYCSYHLAPIHMQQPLKPAIQSFATKKPQGLSEGILCGLSANDALQQCS